MNLLASSGAPVHGDDLGLSPLQVNRSRPGNATVPPMGTVYLYLRIVLHDDLEDELIE